MVMNKPWVPVNRRGNPDRFCEALNAGLQQGVAPKRRIP